MKYYEVHKCQIFDEPDLLSDTDIRGLISDTDINEL